MIVVFNLTTPVPGAQDNSTNTAFAFKPCATPETTDLYNALIQGPHGAGALKYIGTHAAVLAKESDTRWVSTIGDQLDVFVIQYGTVVRMRAKSDTTTIVRAPTTASPAHVADTVVRITQTPDTTTTDTIVVDTLRAAWGTKTSTAHSVLSQLVHPIPGTTDTPDAVIVSAAPTVSVTEADRVSQLITDLGSVLGALSGFATSAVRMGGTPSKATLDSVVVTGYRYFLTRDRATLSISASAGSSPKSSASGAGGGGKGGKGSGHGGGGGAANSTASGDDSNSSSSDNSAPSAGGGGSASVTLATGGIELPFLSVDLRLSDLEVARYDTSSKTIKQGVQPTRVFVGVNFGLQDLLLDRGFWSYPYIGTFVEASSTPLRQFGVILGMRRGLTFTNLVLPYFGRVWSSYDSLSSSGVVITSRSGSWIAGVNLNLTSALSILGGGSKKGTSN